MSAKKNNMRQLAFLCFFVVLGAQLGQMVYQQRTDGATLEKRQERLSEVHSGCQILVEEEVEDAIVSGFVTPGGKQGLAVFKKENKGYKLASTDEREQGRTVLATTYLDDEWYQLIWKNAEDLDYAKVTYTEEDGETEELILNAKDNRILYCEWPEGDAFSMDVVFYTLDGEALE